MDRINDFVGRNRAWLGVTGAIVLAVVLGLFAIGGARAEGIGKGGKVADAGATLVPAAEVSKAMGWTGIGVGAYGSWHNADLDLGPAPITLGSTGYSYGLTASASVQLGQFVLEAFGDYGWVQGDLRDIGVNREMAVGGRAGFLATPNTLVYVLGAKAWAETDWKTIDGWQYGAGMQVRFASTPTYLSLEYRKTDWDVDLPAGLDLSSDTVRAAVTYKLNWK